MRTMLMAPTKKSRSVKKRYKEYAQISPENDVGTSDKCQPQKRKLSDSSGSQWSKDELECFYKAYRKYGKEWSKVASVIRNRTFEMVEALYNMNRAYLSLPDGTASAAGLIAMMTDHYNVQEESGSDRESNDAPEVHSKPKKRRRGEVSLSRFKGDRLQSPPVPPNDRCLSLLRMYSDGRTVRKRTPRIPVSYLSREDGGGNHISSSKRGWKTETNENVAHVAALALTEASKSGSHQPISQSPDRTGHTKLSTPKSQETMPELLATKLCHALIDKDNCEGSYGSRGAVNGIYARPQSTFVDDQSVGVVGAYQKGIKINGKRGKNESRRIDRFDDCPEAFNVARDGLSVSNAEGKFDTEVMNGNSERSSLGKKKRHKKLFFGGDSSELEGLQMLADLSLLMPASGVESELSIALNEDTPVKLTDSAAVLQAGSTSCQGSKNNLRTGEKVLQTISGIDTGKSENNEHGKESGTDFKAVLSEGKQQAQSINKSGKTKHKSSSLKNSEVRDHACCCVNKPLNDGAFAEEEKILVNEVKCASQDFSPEKQSKSVEDGEHSSSNCAMIGEGPDSAVSAALSLISGATGLPAKRSSRRKMNPKMLAIRNEMKSHEFISKDQLDKLSTFQDRSLYLKDKVSCCLSSYMVRNWCTFEWFYSAIDYPWFAKREFVEYLNHVGLGHIPRLTHVEWGVIKSSLGKARRFSENFLRKEREKLKQYRESVRKHYTELQTGVKQGLPTDLARPLSVGQRVVAIHPKSREVHDGCVLTVDNDKCRIQFDRPDLGVEFVMDIDCMPSDPMDNMPEAIKRQLNTVDRSFTNTRGLRPGHSALKRSVEHVPTELLGNAQSSRETFLRQGKEAKLLDIKLINYNLLKNNDNKDSSLKNSETYKQKYNTVSSALLNSRQHNTSPVNTLPSWLKPPASLHGSVVPIKSLDTSVNNQESGSKVVGIVNDLKLEAQAMVNTAIQAMSKLNVGQNTLANVREALYSLDRPDYGSSIIRSSELVNGGLAYNQLKLNSDLSLNSYAFDPKLRHESDGMEAQIPSELITSCVATYLMIQMCTERQCPPADVVRILDSAVTSLYPRCSQNLPIYREIETYMGRVKNHILALVPT